MDESVRVVRGRGADVETDRAATDRLVASVAGDGPPAIRVWRPHRQVAFGRMDVASPAYEGAAAVARTAGYPPVERSVGGRAVAFTGSTVAIAVVTPVKAMRVGLAERYESTTRAVQRALWAVGVPAQRGEPEGAFCPGRHSLQSSGKIAGFAQRIRSSVAIVGGTVIVDDREAIAELLDRIYEVLDVPFDPAAVGSVRRAGGRADPETVMGAVEERLVGDREAIVEDVDAWTWSDRR